MPATYSKKRKRDYDDEQEPSKKPEETPHLGGPLKRSGPQAASWDDVVGSSMKLIPVNELPVKRSILRRYRYLRINEQNKSKQELVTTITEEVLRIWERARVHTADKKIISKSNKCHRRLGEEESQTSEPVE